MSDFVSANSTFLLSAMAMALSAVGLFFTFLLRSRCERLRCCGMECDRQVLSEDAMRTVRVAAPNNP